MKNSRYILICIMLSLLVVGCQKDMSTVSLIAEIESFGGNEKVYLDNQNYACWESGDEVKINNKDYKVEIDNGIAEINQVVYSENGYVAVYPAKSVINANSESITLSLPEKLVYKEVNNRQQIDNPMIAITDSGEGNLRFKNLGGLIGLQLRNDMSGAVVIDSIRLTATESSAILSGMATVTNDTVMAMSNGKNSVLLTGISANIVQGSENVFYINVPPVNVDSNKFKIEIWFRIGETKYQFMRTTKPAVGQIGRNQLGILPIKISSEHAYVVNDNGLLGSGKETEPYIMSSFENLKALKTVSTTNPIYIKQTENIVIPETERWTGIGTIANPFKGAYDGNGHSIKFGNGTAMEITPTDKIGGLFNVVGENTEIKNVVIEGNITSTNCTKFGGIVGSIKGNNVKITNCTNKANITNSVSNLYEFENVGGICGMIEGNLNNVVISGCVNEGIITCSTNTSSAINVGGICGYFMRSTNTGFVNLCNNRGTIKISNAENYHIGGIMGKSSCYVEFNQCINDGTLEDVNSVVLSNDKYAGGIIGQENSLVGIHLVNCASHGQIKKCKFAGGLIGNISGIYTIENSYVTTSFINCTNVGGVIQREQYDNNLELVIKNCYVDDINIIGETQKGWIIGTSSNNYHGIIMENVFVPNNQGFQGPMDKKAQSHVIDATLTDTLNTWVSSHPDQGYSRWKTVDKKPRLEFE